MSERWDKAKPRRHCLTDYYALLCLLLLIQALHICINPLYLFLYHLVKLREHFLLILYCRIRRRFFSFATFPFSDFDITKNRA